MPGANTERAAPASAEALCGFCAGLVARTLSSPLDVLKIRRQIHSAKRPPPSLRLIATTVQREGILALWKGNLAALLLSGGFSSVQFATHRALLETLAPSPLAPSSLDVLVTASLAGCVATLFTYPFDLMRTRLATQSQNQIDAGLFGGMREIVRVNGVKGLFTGVPLAVCGIAPYMGIQFSVYHHLDKRFHRHDMPGVSAAWNGALAGAVGKLATMPFDVIKKRQQVNAFLHQDTAGDASRAQGRAATRHLYSIADTQTINQSVREVVRWIQRQESPAVLFRGSALAMAKSGLQASVLFALMEECRGAARHV